jgi:hypothetical protein
MKANKTLFVNGTNGYSAIIHFDRIETDENKTYLFVGDEYIAFVPTDKIVKITDSY